MRSFILASLGTLLAGGAAASTMTPISSWNGNTGYVEGRPVVSGGVVYGVLSYTPPPGGSDLNGSVYALTPPTSGSTYTQTTISSFTGGAAGGNPNGGLSVSPNGTLYGAAFSGGSLSTVCKADAVQGCGLIYALTKSGNTWTRTTIYTFLGGADGIGPVGNLIADSSGALYGVTQGGGCTPTLTYPIGCGIVFKLTPPTSGTAWTETILYTFKGGATDGANPLGPLARDAAGNIYGATPFGGTAETNCATLTTLPNGNGDGRCGVAFKLAYNSGTGKYAESILHFFTDGADGSIPFGGVVLDGKGNVYGTTLQGGNGGLCFNFGYSGCGVVFELAAASGYAKSNLWSFTGADGAAPSALLISGKNRLFGVTTNNTSDEKCNASAYYCGTAFELTLATGSWHETVLYTFSGMANAITGPEFGLAADTSGKLYGVSLNSATSSAFTLLGNLPSRP